MIPVILLLLLGFACNAKQPSQRAFKALRKELYRYNKAPLDDVMLMTDEDNIACWYFVMAGAKFIDPTVNTPIKSPYARGEYFGLIEFGRNYPDSAFKLYMYTPNGRFDPGQSICMHIGDDHSSSCKWGPQGIVEALRSFMVTEEIGRAQLTDNFKKRNAYALASKNFNLKNNQYAHVFGKQTIESANIEANLAHERSLINEEGIGIEPKNDDMRHAQSDVTNHNELPSSQVENRVLDYQPPKKSFLRRCIEWMSCME